MILVITSKLLSNYYQLLQNLLSITIKLTRLKISISEANSIVWGHSLNYRAIQLLLFPTLKKKILVVSVIISINSAAILL